MRAPKRAKVAGLLLGCCAGALLGSACDDEEQRRRPPLPYRGAPQNRPSSKGASVPSASAPLLEIDPPAPSGDLKRDVESFSTIEACVAAHSGVDPLVADSVDSLGYTNLLHDACRIPEALKAKDKAPCERITASALQARCLSLLAMVTKRPDTCPSAGLASRGDGRQPTCVAVAARDARLCAAEVSSARPRCEALATGNLSRCDAAGGEAKRCARESARIGNMLEGTGPASGAMPVSSAQLVLKVDGGADTRFDVGAELSRGVVLVRGASSTTVRLGAEDVPNPTHFATASNAAVRISVRLTDTGKAVKVEHLELLLPGKTPVVYPGARGELRGSLTYAGSRLGPVQVSVRGQLDGHDVDFQASTWVRDIVNAEAAR
jgi:hypothetical protein